MKQYQTIKDHNGKDLFVLLPVTEFEQLTGKDIHGLPLDDGDDENFVEIDYEQGGDDSVTIPFEVVKLKHKHQVNLLGAWRIYRNLSQQEVAEKTGLSQSAISQAERKDSKPQRKILERFSVLYDCTIEQMS
ncbi:XRE family transcriptional regulator [Bibersteinia trehalosi USDA-ARS-USMARC-190]|uniref:XRE family transcriptional regulator n=1 Tax=Bibersteinia trehalosi USDA-ARS-USMARC-190 TaxID=1263832 RepID=W0RD41_BIBTR|nr:helix-turn-helix transcriptional regulator [Bibersteinia trehalosi]AHG87303.1 XRE family transcriptional regulator [Bibersteinia trehalosi USDA-ARS-USMARC-190]